MPIYEYRCQSCEKITEAMQKFSDAPLVDCEFCGEKGTLSKLISRSSFALKGSGWYTTDYKRAGKTGGAETKTDSAPSVEAAKSEAKTESGGTKSAVTADSSKPSKPASGGSTSST
jgi:putative FmdB family regulatory protein